MRCSARPWVRYQFQDLGSERLTGKPELPVDKHTCLSGPTLTVAARTLFVAPKFEYRGSPANRSRMGRGTGWMTEQMRREWSVPSGAVKINQPEDAARVIVFLASNAARHWTLPRGSIPTFRPIHPGRTDRTRKDRVRVSIPQQKSASPEEHARTRLSQNPK